MVEVCNEFGSVRLFIYLIVRSFPTHNLKICSLVFLSFCMKLGIHKFKKMVMTNLKKKKNQLGQEGTENPKNGAKSRFLESWQKSNPIIYTFLFKYQTINGLLTYCKNHMSGKNLVLDLCLKNI